MKNIFHCHDHHGVARNLTGILDAVQTLWKIKTFTKNRLLLIHEPTSALNKIQFMIRINLLYGYVSAPDYHPKKGFPIKVIEDQHTNLVMHGIHWND